MTFDRSSLLIKKSFLTKALSKCSLYPSLFQLSLVSILFSIFLLCLWSLRKPAEFDFVPCISFCTENILAWLRTAFCFNFENVSKWTKDAKQLAVFIVYFPLENVNKHGFFEILSSQSILLDPSSLLMKNGNGQTHLFQKETSIVDVSKYDSESAVHRCFIE